MNHSLILSAVSLYSQHFKKCSLLGGLLTKGTLNNTSVRHSFQSKRLFSYLAATSKKNVVGNHAVKNYSQAMSVTNSEKILNTNASQPGVNVLLKSEDDISKDLSGSGGDHLQRTAEQQRQSQVHQLKVVKVFDISPTVKKLVLKTDVRPVPFSFKAGQWVDVFIPGIDTVGGFSICSSPIHLKTTGELILCIKKSNQSPSNWVHSQCKEGSDISVRIGGEFFLDTNDTANTGKSILLLAGGVGINPLVSIISQLQDYKKTIGLYSSGILLMYSAKTHSELLFRDSFEKSSEDDPTFSAQFYVTKESPEHSAFLSDNLKYGRISKSDIVRSLASRLHLCPGFEDINTNIVVYICGPPPMIQDTKEILTSLGITNINYEKWW